MRHNRSSPKIMAQFSRSRRLRLRRPYGRCKLRDSLYIEECVFRVSIPGERKPPRACSVLARIVMSPSDALFDQRAGPAQRVEFAAPPDLPPTSANAWRSKKRK